jgi:hypothetical protein
MGNSISGWDLVKKMGKDDRFCLGKPGFSGSLQEVPHKKKNPNQAIDLTHHSWFQNEHTPMPMLLI